MMATWRRRLCGWPGFGVVVVSMLLLEAGLCRLVHALDVTRTLISASAFSPLLSLLLALAYVGLRLLTHWLGPGIVAAWLVGRGVALIARRSTPPAVAPPAES